MELMNVCWACFGVGKNEQEMKSMKTGKMVFVNVPCEACEGTGQVLTDIGKQFVDFINFGIKNGLIDLGRKR